MKIPEQNPNFYSLTPILSLCLWMWEYNFVTELLLSPKIVDVMLKIIKGHLKEGEKLNLKWTWKKKLLPYESTPLADHDFSFEICSS